jgi:hypothetical protein
MSSPWMGIAIEALVAVLLVMTIGFCWRLNGRLARLRADENAMRETIGELFTATEAAERAIGILKDMVGECDRSLGQRLSSANLVATEIGAQIRAGETILNRIALITEAARRQPALSAGAPAREPSFAKPAHAPVAFAVNEPDGRTAQQPSYDKRSSTARAAAAVADALAERARLRSRGEAA